MSVITKNELTLLSEDALRVRAAELFIPHFDRLTKQELIEAIVASPSAPPLAAHGSGAWMRRLRPIEERAEPMGVKEEAGEPTSIFIDRGLPIPEVYPGQVMRVLVRDPRTLFVYWELEGPYAEAWEIYALDHSGAVVSSFRTDGSTSGSGYLYVAAAHVSKVSLAPLDAAGVVQAPRFAVPLVVPREEFILDSTDERWVDIRLPLGASAPSVVAPSAGRAPLALEEEYLGASPTRKGPGAPIGAPGPGAVPSSVGSVPSSMPSSLSVPSSPFTPRG